MVTTMKVDELINLLRQRGLTTDDAVELLHILTKIQYKKVDAELARTRVGGVGMDTQLIALCETLKEDYT